MCEHNTFMFTLTVCLALDRKQDMHLFFPSSTWFMLCDFTSESMTGSGLVLSASKKQKKQKTIACNDCLYKGGTQIKSERLLMTA